MTMDTPASSESDAIFHHGEAAQAKFQQEKPWSNDPHFFKHVKGTETRVKAHADAYEHVVDYSQTNKQVLP